MYVCANWDELQANCILGVRLVVSTSWWNVIESAEVIHKARVRPEVSL